MKKFLITAIFAITSISVASDDSSIFDSPWFEPGVACAIGGTVGYYSSSTGKELPSALIGCLVSGFVVDKVSSYFEKKYTRSKDKELEKYKEAMRAINEALAKKAANGERDIFSVRVQEIVPGQKLPNGDIMAPTIKEKLIMPGSDLLLGD